jgi:hypothetical protein
VDGLKLGTFSIKRIVRSKKWGTDVQKTPNLVEIELQKLRDLQSFVGLIGLLKWES